MFSRRNRLSRDEIALVTKVGKSVHTPLLSLKTIHAPEGETLSKYAFVISKKEEKTAVSRNRAERRVRAAMRRVVADISKPLYCMVFIKKSVLKVSFNDIVLTLRRALLSFIIS